MMELGKKLAGLLRASVQVELIGDVGVGKTTFVKGLAKGLGVEEAVTSPSFTINKRYAGGCGVVLSHYDFYRLDEAGLMKNEIAESGQDKKVVTVVEWGESVADVLDDTRVKIWISYNDDGSRTVEMEGTRL